MFTLAVLRRASTLVAPRVSATRVPVAAMAMSAVAGSRQPAEPRDWRWMLGAAAGLAGLASFAACADKKAEAAAEDEAEEDGKKKKKKKKDADCGSQLRPRATTFREQQISDYEDRVRYFSSPEKVFRYFATVSVDGVVYMRPQDFIRSLTPGELQPSKYGLDKFEAIEPSKLPPTDGKGPIFQFDSDGNVTNKSGFITFAEYLFLLTVLCTPKRQFEIAFQMVDLDGNGIVDLDEFSMVQTAVMTKSSAGRRLHHTIDDSVKHVMLSRSYMLQRLFGQDGKSKCDLKKFNSFVDELQDTVLHLDFLIHNVQMKDRNYISEKGLARMLLKYGKIRREDRGVYYERIEKHYDANSKGLTFKEVAQFFDFLTSIDDVETAFSLYDAAGASITEKDFLRATRSVTKRPLSPEIVHFVFVLFDENGDGELNYSEFVHHMKDARTRGLSRSRHMGAGKGFKALVNCIKYQMAPPNAE